jgi:hypothetical protein
MAASTTTYNAPLLVREGSVQQLTFGQSDGDFLDRDFPVNTPKKKLTFS